MSQSLKMKQFCSPYYGNDGLLRRQNSPHQTALPSDDCGHTALKKAQSPSIIHFGTAQNGVRLQQEPQGMMAIVLSLGKFVSLRRLVKLNSLYSWCLCYYIVPLSLPSFFMLWSIPQETQIISPCHFSPTQIRTNKWARHSWWTCQWLSAPRP